MAMSDPKLVDKKVLYNRGIRTYVTSAGALLPGKSVALDAKEADKLLKIGYRDLSDIQQVAPQAAAQMKQLADENKSLKVENDALKAELEASKGKKKEGGEKDK
jgi:hypothetical protein